MVVFSLILAIGFLMAVIEVPMHLVLQVTLLLGGSIFAFWAIGIALQLLKQDVVLPFSAEGIFDQRVDPQVIPWDEIDENYLYRGRSQRFLAVVVANRDRYAAPAQWTDKLSLWTMI
jgi:hypothetical protein